MLELSRTVRFCLAQDGSLAVDAPAANTFAAWPPMRGLGRYYELRVTCRGQADPVTGFFMNIKRVDQAARTQALPLVASAARSDVPVALGGLLRDIAGALNPALDGSLTAVELKLTPTYRIGIETGDMQHTLISQQFEFSAAHRLHAPQLTPQQNVEMFGKCNNPAGHGHNYSLEVTVRCPIDDAGHAMPIERLDELVNRVVVEKLDHKNLDVDVPQFKGMNTTVENIARVVYGMLAEAVREKGCLLHEVRVWETGKTVCTYRGQ